MPCIQSGSVLHEAGRESPALGGLQFAMKKHLVKTTQCQNSVTEHLSSRSRLTRLKDNHSFEPGPLEVPISLSTVVLGHHHEGTYYAGTVVT